VAGSYRPQVFECTGPPGATANTSPATPPAPAAPAPGYLVSAGQLESARTPRTRLLLVSSPAGPTGAVHPPDEVAEIGRWASDTGLRVITDETYEHLVYGGATAPSMPALLPELQPRCVAVNGVGTSCGMSGWGWAGCWARRTWSRPPPPCRPSPAPPWRRSSSGPPPRPLAGDQSGVAAMRTAFDRRRQIVVGMLRQVPGLACPELQGACSVYPSVTALLGRPIAGRTAATSAELAELLLTGARVAVVPGEAFGTPGYLRLSYAVEDAELVEGLHRLLGSAG